MRCGARDGWRGSRQALAVSRRAAGVARRLRLGVSATYSLARARRRCPPRARAAARRPPRARRSSRPGRPRRARMARCGARVRALPALGRHGLFSHGRRRGRPQSRDEAAQLADEAFHAAVVQAHVLSRRSERSRAARSARSARESQARAPLEIAEPLLKARARRGARSRAPRPRTARPRHSSRCTRSSCPASSRALRSLAPRRRLNRSISVAALAFEIGQPILRLDAQLLLGVLALLGAPQLMLVRGSSDRRRGLLALEQLRLRRRSSSASRRRCCRLATCASSVCTVASAASARRMRAVSPDSAARRARRSASRSPSPARPGRPRPVPGAGRALRAVCPPPRPCPPPGVSLSSAVTMTASYGAHRTSPASGGATLVRTCATAASLRPRVALTLCCAGARPSATAATTAR